MPEDAEQSMRAAAQNFIRERFSEDIVVSNYLGLFESLLAKGPAPASAPSTR
jgi:hypothetical protein